MPAIRNILNAIAGWFIARRCAVQVGSETRVSWLKLKGHGGGILKVGNQSDIHCRIDFDSSGGVVEVGDRTFIGASHIVCHTNIRIGNDVLISWGVTIVDHNSHALDWTHRKNDVVDWMQGNKNWDHVKIAPVIICDKAWVGFGVSILKGVTIGEGAVIGAGSIVTRDVEPWTAVAGNPARVIRKLGVSE